MKIDQRLTSLLSKDQLDNLLRRASKLEDGEGEVFNLVVMGFIYPIAVTSREISAFPLM